MKKDKNSTKPALHLTMSSISTQPTNKTEVVSKIIQKACDGGWNPVIKALNSPEGKTVRLQDKPDEHCPDRYHFGIMEANIMYDPYSVVFRHDFARAFWGEDEIEVGHFNMAGQYTLNAADVYAKCWAYHIQQMVLEPDPIEYLKRFL